MATMCSENCTNGGILYDLVSEDIWAPWYAALDYFEYQPWLFSLIGSLMVGLSGIFPLLVIPIEEGVNVKQGENAGTLNVLLSFAVGGLLGDVFLHLLPEAWANKALNQGSEDGHPSMTCSLWVLAGFLVFVIAEKLFSGVADHVQGEEDDDENEHKEIEVGDKSAISNYALAQNLHCEKSASEMLNNNFQKELENNNCLMPNGNVKNGCIRNACITNGLIKDFSKLNGCFELANNCKNGFSKVFNGCLLNEANFHISAKQSLELNGCTKITNDYVKVVGATKINEASSDAISKNFTQKEKAKHIAGYLNLLANSIDNFTHGLAVGGAFLVSFRLGALTTLAILVHEIPHEVGDFAILLRSGFNRWDAARAQLLTAGGGIIGALVAVLCSGGGVEARTSWILPFTAGGFLHIGLVTVLPELLQETNPRESMKQLGALLLGIAVMALMTVICD